MQFNFLKIHALLGPQSKSYTPIRKLGSAWLWVCVLVCGLSFVATAANKERHVVVIVWDGMRPDFISEKNTPALFALASRGVTFENHHPVFVSMTEPNGAVLATGDYPAHTGVLADAEYRPDIDPLRPVHMEELRVVRRGDELSRGHYLGAPTIAEILQKAGRKTAVAGSKGIALLADRADRMTGAASPNLFAGRTLPADLFDVITNLHGEFPELVAEQPTRNDWTTTALLNPVWREKVPDFSFVWLNEPDLAQHRTGVGSDHSLAMIRNADDNLARVLHALDALGVRESTDVLVVSDHGFSTITALVDLADSIQVAGINAQRSFTNMPSRGDVLVVGAGGSALIYVIGHEEKIVGKVVDFLQAWNRTGVIFTRQPVPGTFTLAQIHDDAPAAPDVLVSLRWTADKNDVAVPGMIFSDLSDYGAGQGMHGSLGRFDMRNTLIAAGPDFRAGVVDHLPTGNVDIAPTVLWLLGVKPPKPMDGRVLTEVLTIAGPKIKSYEPRHLEAGSTNEKTVWHQFLNYTQVNGVDYFDEGNGNQTVK